MASATKPPQPIEIALLKRIVDAVERRRAAARALATPPEDPLEHYG